MGIEVGEPLFFRTSVNQTQGFASQPQTLNPVYIHIYIYIYIYIYLFIYLYLFIYIYIYIDNIDNIDYKIMDFFLIIYC